MKPRTHLRFGSHDIEIDVESLGQTVHRESHDTPTAVSDIKAAVRKSLATPSGYPPLADAILEGDLVTIAVDWGVPRLPTILAGLLETLGEAGLTSADVRVVVADERDERETLLADAAAEWQSVPVSWHDPTDRDGLAYLAVNHEGEPIYFSRSVLDADFVIPIAVRRSEFSLGEFGIYSGLFPAFTDAATACRFASDDALSPAGRENLRKTADEAGWLLGSRFTVQVIPSTGDEITQIVSGDVDSVSTESQQLIGSAWKATVDEPAHLVVACVGGDKSQQTWRNVARALEAAVQVAAEDGSILICCELDGYLGPALQRLSQFDPGDDEPHGFGDPPFELEDVDPRSDEPAPDTRFSDDMLLAAALRWALPRHRIYLYSALDEDEVASIGLIHVSSAAEIANLCRRHRSYVVLADAQNTHAQLRAESPTS